ncbi:MAG TPA: hypothetical protein VIW01_07260 [Dehalococcoidia bacterium]
MATKSDAFRQRQSLVRSHLPELVLVGAAGGFAVTFAELLSTDHSEGTQAIAVVAAGAGVVLCLVGLLVHARLTLRALAAGLLFMSISGPVGVFLHAGGEADASGAPAVVDDVPALDSDEDEDEGEEEGEDSGVPPLAPLGLSGLGLLGAAGALARED